MSFGPAKYQYATMLSGGDSAVAYYPAAYTRLFVRAPTMSTAAEKAVYGSMDGVTYWPMHFSLSSGVTNPGTIIIGSQVTNKVVEVACYPLPYIKLVTTDVVSGGGVYTFIYV